MIITNINNENVDKKGKKRRSISNLAIEVTTSGPKDTFPRVI